MCGLKLKAMIKTITVLSMLIYIVKTDTNPEYYSAMIEVDQELGTHYVQTFGDPSVSCNCSNNNGNPFPCLWTDGLNGFSCSEGPDATVISFSHISLPSLSGRIPDSLGNIGSLTTIQIQFTNMSGPLPTSLLSLSNLTILAITDTQINGSIFSTTSLANLKDLYLYDNELEGTLPTFSPSISRLQLQNNNLNGTLDLLGSLNLTILTLQNNYFSGTIPSSFSTLNFMTFEVSNNFLTGDLPSLQVPFDNCYALNMSLSDCKESPICQVSCRPLCTGEAPIDSFCLNDTWIYIGDYTNPNIIELRIH